MQILAAEREKDLRRSDPMDSTPPLHSLFSLWSHSSPLHYIVFHSLPLHGFCQLQLCIMHTTASAVEAASLLYTMRGTVDMEEARTRRIMTRNEQETCLQKWNLMELVCLCSGRSPRY